jgi:protein-tyrosine phosphatase
VTGWLDERSRNGGADEIPLPDGEPGRLVVCGKHFVGPDVEDALARTATTAVVCLNEEHEIGDRYPDYVAWLRANTPQRALWHPIPDLHAPAIDDARALVAELRARLSAGEHVLLHCGAGIGRAGTFAAAVLLDHGVPLDDALATVRAARPMAGPEVGAQLELLRAFSGH